VNVGNLLLARGAARQHELGLRRALGASRTRLLRQLLTEGLVLATGGCVCGVLVALATTRILAASLPSIVPAFGTQLHLTLDWRALAFAMMASIAAGIVSNVTPARITMRMRGLQMLRGNAVVARRRRQLGVIAQVALSLLLLLVAGSFVQRLLQLQTTTLGFAVEGRIYAYTFVPSDSTTPESRTAFYQRALDRLQTLPGVRSTALTSAMPLMPTDSECISDPPLKEQVSDSAVSPRYFDTLGISLVDGGDFSATNATTPQGVIINETLSRQLWRGTSAVGRRITIGCKASRTELVLGVVRDSVLGAVGEEPRPHLYRSFTSADTGRLVPIIISVAGDANAINELIRRSLIDLGNGVRVYAVAPLSVYVEQSYGQLQWMTRMLAALGLLALVLAVVGLYGVMAYRVALRTREIGVRMALGAHRVDVFREVIAQGVGAVLIGLGSGEILAMTTLGWLGSMQEGIRQPSTVIHGVTAILWLGAALLASYLPAARAAGVDPLVALRHE
jgi:putative ABC transport system permease protein